MPYQELMIAPFKEGERRDVDSWLLPNEAFVSLENCFLRRGILQKRHGIKHFGRMGTKHAALGIGTGGGGKTYSSVTVPSPLTDIPVIKGSVIVTDALGQETFRDNGDGTLTGSAGGTGTVNYTTGAWTLTYNANLAGGTAITANYYVGDATDARMIRGIFDLENDNQTDVLLVADRQNLGVWNTTYDYFINTTLHVAGTHDYFGNKANLCWGVGYQGKQYICDGVDANASGIWTYSPALAGGAGAIMRRKPAIALSTVAGTTVTAEIIGAGSGATTYTGTLAFPPIIEGSMTAVNAAGPTETFTDNGDGTLTGSLGGSGTINYVTGQWTLTFNAALAAGNITSDYQKNLIFCDFALSMHPYHRRLVLFHTSESTNGGTTHTVYRQRARWNKISSEYRWRADIGGQGSSLDADTNETIVGTGIFKGVIVVAFERSIWLFEATGHYDIPFRWRRLAGNLEINSLLGTICTEEMIIFVGHGGIYGCDGVHVQRIDEKLPDFTDEDINLTFIKNCAAIYDQKLEQGLLTYTSVGQGGVINNRTLALGLDAGWFSEYGWGMNYLGKYKNIDGTTWTILYTTGMKWEAPTFDGKRWMDIYQQDQEELILGGKDKGYVYSVNDTSVGTDEIEEVIKYYNFDIVSKRFTPFVAQGDKTTLGYLDMLVDKTSNAACVVRLYNGENVGQYAEKKVTFQQSIPGNKIWKRVLVNNIANAHGFEITMDGSQMSDVDIASSGLRIHAFRLGLRPAGKLRLS